MVELFFQDFFTWEYLTIVNGFWMEIGKFILFAAAGVGIAMSVRRKWLWSVIFAVLFICIHCLASGSMTSDAVADRFAWTFDIVMIIDGLLIGCIGGMLVKKGKEEKE